MGLSGGSSLLAFQYSVAPRDLMDRSRWEGNGGLGLQGKGGVERRGPGVMVGGSDVYLGHLAGGRGDGGREGGDPGGCGA